MSGISRVSEERKRAQCDLLGGMDMELSDEVAHVYRA
jgi:hypothetical protein